MLNKVNLIFRNMLSSNLNSICAISLVLMTSCYPASFKNPNLETEDSVFYELSNEAMYRLQSLINGKKISYLSLLSNSNENRYFFSFHFKEISDDTECKVLLVGRSKRFMVISKKTYAVLLEEDLLFSNKACIDTIRYHGKSSGVIVNARGELLDYW